MIRFWHFGRYSFFFFSFWCYVFHRFYFIQHTNNIQNITCHTYGLGQPLSTYPCLRPVMYQTMNGKCTAGMFETGVVSFTLGSFIFTLHNMMSKKNWSLKLQVFQQSVFSTGIFLVGGTQVPRMFLKIDLINNRFMFFYSHLADGL